MAPSNWTDSTDRQLLLIMLHLAAPQLPKWDTVADLMGPDFTAEAVRSVVPARSVRLKGRY